MRACIHRGTQEVGGTCIELESQGKRVVLDVGLPLNATDSVESLPRVEGFREQHESLLAVILSHPHLDHYGLIHHLPPETQIIMGAATERILEAATLFTSTGVAFNNVLHLESAKPLTTGPFTITPYLNDHSAYDTYSLLISADGEQLFYSSDFRGHGRKSALFESFLKNPPSNVNALLMEGTTIGRSGSETGFRTEQELERCFLDHVDDTAGMLLIWASGQNIDRLVTVYKACRTADRQLILDIYTAEILRATGNPNLPQAKWNGIKVFLPSSQRKRIIKNRQYQLAERYKPYRIYPEQLAAEASQSVMLFRPSMMRDLEEADCLHDARLVYSLWPGYLRRDDLHSFHEWLSARSIPLVHCHTSGHASPRDLQRFAKAIAPKMLVPIHSFGTDRFSEYFDNVEMKNDGQWWEVAYA